MLMAILNVEQARSSNVKRDQQHPKFASNWHFTEFFRILLLIFMSNFLFLVHIQGLRTTFIHSERSLNH
jgi:hypothetical protein